MKKIVLIAAALVLLPACAQKLTGAGTPSFNPEKPNIYVVVGSSGTAYLVVDQEPIVITKKGKSKIKWKIQTAGYKFDKNNGIQVNPKLYSGVAGQVSGCQPEPNTGDDEFGCDDDNNGKGTHKYTINVVGPSGALKLDPWIVND